jgi:DNA-binding NarL/FixJ family response regulator
VRLMIVDDKPMFREGLKRVLQGIGSMEVVAEFGDGPAAIRHAREGTVDGAIVDTLLPGMDGVTLIRELLRGPRRLKLVVVTAHPGRRLFADAVQAGAAGYVLKSDAIDVFVTAMRVVARGGTYFSPALGGAERPGRALGPLDTLTAREQTVFRLTVKGLTTRQIAAALAITQKTVETHRSHVNRKLSCHSPASLIRFAVINDLLEDVAPSHHALAALPGDGAATMAAGA